MSAKISHNILRQSRVVGARSVLWLRTGGKLVYERQGLLGSHLGSWYANMLAVVMTTRFEMFPPGEGDLPGPKRLDVDGVGRRDKKTSDLRFGETY